MSRVIPTESIQEVIAEMQTVESRLREQAVYAAYNYLLADIERNNEAAKNNRLLFIEVESGRKYLEMYRDRLYKVLNNV